MRKIALFDLDDTLADYSGKLIFDLNQIRSEGEPVVTKELLYGPDKPQYLERRRHMITSQSGWFKNLGTLEAGFEIFEMCQDIGYDIGILTKAPKSKLNVASEKMVWCDEIFANDSIEGVTVCHDKSLVYADVLVDDWVGYVEDWLKFRPRGLVIMPAHVHNENFSHSNVIRHTGSNHREVEAALKQQFERQKGQHRKIL